MSNAPMLRTAQRAIQKLEKSVERLTISNNLGGPQLLIEDGGKPVNGRDSMMRYSFLQYDVINKQKINKDSFLGSRINLQPQNTERVSPTERDNGKLSARMNS